MDELIARIDTGWSRPVADDDANSPTLFNIFISWFPVLLLIGV